MAKCAACGKFMTAGGAACTLCPLTYHMDCVAFSRSSKVPHDWACPECKKKQRKGDNSGTPVKGIEGAPVPALKATSGSSAEDSEVRAMRRELAEYMVEQREFRSEMRAAMATITARVDGIERRLEEVEKRELVAPVQAEKVAELQQTVCRLQLELNDPEQEGLLNDLDIGHLPEVKGENVLHTVTVLAAKMGVAIEARDIVYAERVGAVAGAEARGAGGAEDASSAVGFLW